MIRRVFYYFSCPEGKSCLVINQEGFEFLQYQCLQQISNTDSDKGCTLFSSLSKLIPGLYFEVDHVYLLTNPCLLTVEGHLYLIQRIHSAVEAASLNKLRNCHLWCMALVFTS